MHCQQNRCPHGVEVVTTRTDRHRGHLRRELTSPPGGDSADALHPATCGEAVGCCTVPGGTSSYITEYEWLIESHAYFRTHTSDPLVNHTGTTWFEAGLPHVGSLAFAVLLLQQQPIMSKKHAEYAGCVHEQGDSMCHARYWGATGCLHEGENVELPRVDNIKQLVMQWLSNFDLD